MKRTVSVVVHERTCRAWVVKTGPHRCRVAGRGARGPNSSRSARVPSAPRTGPEGVAAPLAALSSEGRPTTGATHSPSSALRALFDPRWNRPTPRASSAGAVAGELDGLLEGGSVLP